MLAASNLKLNMKKAEFLLNGFKQRLSYLPESLEVEVNKIPVKGISTTKYLGIYYDENLRWQFHIKEIYQRIFPPIKLPLDAQDILFLETFF